MDWSKVTVGFIGAGKMAQALIRGMTASGKLKASQLFASAPEWDVVNLNKLDQMNIRKTSDNVQLAKESDVIVLAVKPNLIKDVCNEIQQSVRSTNQKLLVSIAAGISTANIEKFCNKKYRVARVMPNTAVAVMEGTSLFCLGSTHMREDYLLVQEMFSSVGYVIELSEELFDAAIGLSSCGPAYMYLALEALAEGGVKLGLARDVALKLAAYTMKGAATMAIDTGTHPSILREEVESPGGATVCGVHELEKHAYKSALICAVEAAALKSAQLGNKMNDA
uniref:Pyrroline-5-carboxylate reductase n=1 Tax=Trichuris muris TaxID=70415 RepID=A0A5S6QUF5_TRIMR